MRVSVIIGFIATILLFVFTAEYIIITEFYNELRCDAATMKTAVTEGIIREDDAVNIVKKWENCKGKLYIFENHEYFKNLEESVYSLEFSAKKEEVRNILFILERLIVLSNEAKYDFALSLGNIF